MTRGRSWAVIGLAIVLLTSCAPSESSPPGSDLEAGGPQERLDDISGRLESCAAEFGWIVHATDDGGVTWSEEDNPSEQREQILADLAVCSERLEIPAITALSEAQQRELYAQELANLECMAEQGYDTADPPSFQEYAQRLGTEKQWSSDLMLLDLPIAEATRLTESCVPPMWTMEVG